MLFDDHWVYFCRTINAYAKAETVAAEGGRALRMLKVTLSA
jgi:hypothetical protein